MATALAWAAWSCAAATGGDASFRTQDRRILEAFADLKDRCAPGWPEENGCRARLRELRAEEVRLFDEVRAHRFADLTESSYWHRGRLKFPGEVQQVLERVEAPRE